MSFLRPSQRSAMEQDLQAATSLLENPESAQYIVDKTAMRKYVANLKKTIESQAPKPFESPAVIAQKTLEEKALREEWLQGMPSQEEMRRNRAGTVHQHMQWEKANKKKILKWKEIKARLDWKSEDPDLCNIERYRPSRPFAYDTTAQIAGHHAMSPQAKENYPPDMGQDVHSAIAHLEMGEELAEDAEELPPAKPKKETLAMPFPYTTITNFEDGTDGAYFTVETDANSALDFPHYSELARTPGVPMPWRGAYLMRINLALSSTDGAQIQDTTNILPAQATNSAYVKIKFWVSSNLTMANNDVLNIIDFRSGADVTPHTDGTAEAVGAIKYTTAAGFQIGIGETAPTSLRDLTLNQWHDFEMLVDPENGAGTIDAWLDGVALTQVGSLTQATITSLAVGAVGQDAGTTAGTIYIDHIIGHLDGARIGGPLERFPSQLLLEASGHAFVGKGIVDNASLYSGGAADNVLTFYDTDEANTTTSSIKLILKNLSNDETPVDPAGVPLEFTKGCYVSMAGTNPRAMLNIRQGMGYSSDGAIRTVASRR